ncbi:hypothetical protein B0H13DRAFT_2364068 [Mycena leptocephala]|nr:hypothetical protein B0H13DRAFT_2364068 [Mycena leptocephala]
MNSQFLRAAKVGQGPECTLCAQVFLALTLSPAIHTILLLRPLHWYPCVETKYLKSPCDGSRRGDADGVLAAERRASASQPMSVDTESPERYLFSHILGGGFSSITEPAANRSPMSVCTMELMVVEGVARSSLV